MEPVIISSTREDIVIKHSKYIPREISMNQQTNTRIKQQHKTGETIEYFCIIQYTFEGQLNEYVPPFLPFGSLSVSCCSATRELLTDRCPL